MNQGNLVATLRQIEILVADCLKAVGDTPHASPIQKSSSLPKRADVLALPDQIVELRNKGFFVEPRTAREVHEKLRTSYACEANRVVMALLRLNGRKKLRRASKVIDKKRQVAYVW